MVDQCGACGSFDVQESYQCYSCSYLSCVNCKNWINQADYENHLDDCEASGMRLTQAPAVASGSSSSSSSAYSQSEMLCPCGGSSRFASNVSTCDKCLRLLRTPANSRGLIFHLHQTVVFPRKITGILDDGVIIDIQTVKETGGKEVVRLRIKYASKDYNADKYDVLGVSLDSISLDRDTASIGKRSRKLVQITNIAPSPSLTTTSSRSSNTNESNDFKKAKTEPKAGRSNKIEQNFMRYVDDSSEVPNFYNNKKKTMRTAPVPNGLKKESKRKPVKAENFVETANSDEGGDLKARGSLAEILKKPFQQCDLDQVLDIVDVVVDSADASVFEAMAQRAAGPITAAAPALNRFRGYPGVWRGDTYIKRGVMCAVYNWALPPLAKTQLDELGAAARKPDVSVAALQALVRFSPVTTAEMRQHPDLVDLSELPVITVDVGRRGSVSVADEVIEVIRKYLLSRNIILEEGQEAASVHCQQGSVAHGDGDAACNLSMDQLCALRLQLPLSYPHFCSVLKLAADEAELHRSRDIKGVKNLEGIRTMYGAVLESAIEATAQRTSVGKHNIFLDVGSGVGQVCLQMAATIGCVSHGMEIEEKRFEKSLQLLRDFDAVLETIGVTGRLSELVRLERRNLIDCGGLIARCDVIFFNNFGTWFTDPIPECQGRSAMQVFCMHLKWCVVGTRITVMNPLIDASRWLLLRETKLFTNAVSWSTKEVLFHFYNLVLKEWSCPICTLLNELESEQCECGYVYKAQRTGQNLSNNR